MSLPKSKRYVGKYELGRSIGEGAFAKVRFAKNTETGEHVAIKILEKAKVFKNKLVEQVKREISIMKLIKHPNVIRVHEVMGRKTKIFIVMEYATGGEIIDKIEKHGRMNEEEARGYFQQLISVVDFCHSRGVYHRDLKPENLLLDAGGRLKVSDFGLSALSRHVQADGLLHTCCGTLHYAAPEVIDNRGYDGAPADLWSCGVILFTLLTGKLPFEDPSLGTLYKKISSAEFKFPCWVSSGAQQLITRILDPNPMTRMTISQILKDGWFKVGYKPPLFEKNYCTDSDDTVDIEAAFEDSEDCQESEKKEEPPAAMNAFDIISMSSWMNLGTLFGVEKEYKRESRLPLKCSAKQIVTKIEETAKSLGFGIHKKNYKMRLENHEVGRKGNLKVNAEIFQMDPFHHVVEVKKAKGDTLEFVKFYNKLSTTLKDVAWKTEEMPPITAV